MVTMEVDRENVLQVSSHHSEIDVDELQYSRLIYTIGKDAMKSIRKSRALIVGCRGLGAEIAKNLLLSRIERLGLSDRGTVSMADLQFLPPGTRFGSESCSRVV